MKRFPADRLLMRLYLLGLLFMSSMTPYVNGHTMQRAKWDSQSELRQARAEFSGGHEAQMVRRSKIGRGIQSGLENGMAERLALQAEREAKPLWHGAAGGSRTLLGLPTSRRERLQLSNKEKARTERRARARMRRQNMEQMEEEKQEPEKERSRGHSREDTAEQHHQIRRPNARTRSNQQVAGQVLESQATLQRGEALPAHAFGVEGMRTQAESGKEGDSQKLDESAARDTLGQEGGKVEGQRASEGSGAADSGAATTNRKEGTQGKGESAASDEFSELPGNVQLGGLAFEDEEQALSATTLQSSGEGMQEKSGGADLPQELGGAVDVAANAESTAEM